MKNSATNSLQIGQAVPVTNQKVIATVELFRTTFSLSSEKTVIIEYCCILQHSKPLPNYLSVTP
eukprot:2914006-Amphidinium_carterae.2